MPFSFASSAVFLAWFLSCLGVGDSFSFFDACFFWAGQRVLPLSAYLNVGGMEKCA